MLTAADIPPVLTGRRLRDMPMLARDRVRFIGEKIAVVAAEDRDTAEEAAQLIEVDYEELPAVYDPLVAITDSAPLLHEGLKEYKGLPKLSSIRNTYSHDQWLLGDLERGFQESDHIFEHSFTTQHVHQSYLEPHSSVLSIDPQTGAIHVSIATKFPIKLSKILPRPSVCPRTKSSSMSQRSAAILAAKAL